MICADHRNPAAVALHEALMTHLPEGVSGDELVVVIGGDGFLLRTVADLGTGHTFLGLNAGHLGFLLNDVTDWPTVVAHLRARTMRTHTFPLLHATITLADGTVVQDRAVNDVYLERASGQTARLAIAIDGHTVVDPLVADGVIFATALGSTAYTFSAGGMACHPELPVLTVTPICPHHPRLPPLALPATATATVDVLHATHRPVRAVVDGRAHDPAVHVTVAHQGDAVRLAYLPGHDFTNQMIRKILRP